MCRNSWNPQHHHGDCWCWPMLFTSALLRLAMTFVNSLQPPLAWPSLVATFSPPPPSNHLYLSVQFYTVSRAIGSILKPWHLAWGKKNITDTVCPTRAQAQQVINTWKLFWCPGSALTLQFPAIHFRAYHSVDLYTGVICPVLCVHLFSLFVSPHAVFFWQAQDLKAALPDL